MKLTQRKLFTSTIFEFGPQRLSYTFRNPGGSRQLTVDYADVSPDERRITERYPSFLIFGLIVFAVGVLLGGFIYESENRFSGFGFALWGVIFLVFYFLQRKEYVILSAGNDTIVVLGGKNGETILREIASARRVRFLELLRRSDFLEDEVKRKGLISWLVERQIVSNQEAEELLEGAEVVGSEVSRGIKAIH